MEYPQIGVHKCTALLHHSTFTIAAPICLLSHCVACLSIQCNKSGKKLSSSITSQFANHYFELKGFVYWATYIQPLLWYRCSHCHAPNLGAGLARLTQSQLEAGLQAGLSRMHGTITGVTYQSNGYRKCVRPRCSVPCSSPLSRPLVCTWLTYAHSRQQ